MTAKLLWDEPELAPAAWGDELNAHFEVVPCRATPPDDLGPLVQRVRPNVFLLLQKTLTEVGMPVLARWHHSAPTMSIVVVGQHREQDAALVRDALVHGAADFVFTTDGAWEVLHRVQRLVQAAPAAELRHVLATEPPIKTAPFAQLHDSKSGRINAKLMAEYLGVHLKVLCQGLGRGYAGVHKNPAGAAVQKGLHPIIKILEYLRVLLPKESDMRVWLNSPHADLEGHTPLAVILNGKSQIVCDMLEGAINGYPS